MTTTQQQIGLLEIRETKDETLVEWNIPDYNALSAVPASYTSSKFVFQNNSWDFVLKKIHTGHALFRLENSDAKTRDYVTEYEFRLKVINYGQKFLVKGFIGTMDLCSIEIAVIPKLIFNRMEISNGRCNISIICILKYRGNPKQLNTVNNFKYKKLKKLDTLSENFMNLYSNTESCDTVLNVKDKEYRAHRAVLIARSSVFASMFSHDTLEKQTGIVNIPDCDPDSFEIFLKFLYCGRVEEISPIQSAIHLYETSEKYNVQELKLFSAGYLKENMTAETFCDVAVIADKYDDNFLLDGVQSFFNNNLHEVFVTADWQDLMQMNSYLANKLLIEMSKEKPVNKASK